MCKWEKWLKVIFTTSKLGLIIILVLKVSILSIPSSKFAMAINVILLFTEIRKLKSILYAC